MARKRNKGKRKVQIPKEVPGSVVPTFHVPQQDVGNILVNQVARWETNASLTAFALNIRTLIACLNCMAVGTTTVWSTFFAIRLKKIVFYLPANPTTSASNGAAEWYAPAGTSLGIKPSSMTSGSLGTASGSMITMIPPKGTLWENWVTLNSPGSVTCMVFSMPTNIIMDVYYDAYIDNGDGSISFTVAGAVQGSNYRLGCDGLPKASSNFQVMGYASQ